MPEASEVKSVKSTKADSAPQPPVTEQPPASSARRKPTRRAESAKETDLPPSGRWIVSDGERTETIEARSASGAKYAFMEKYGICDRSQQWSINPA